MYIYVLNRNNQPLMPTKRARHVRKLLDTGKAVVLNSNPFTIKLKYETKNILQSLYLGEDPGRENVGASVSNEDGECVYRAHLQTNNKTIKDNMNDRKNHRRERRFHSRQRKQRKALRDDQHIVSDNETLLKNRKTVKSVLIKYPGMEEKIEHKVIKGKESKFNNRKRKDDWLTPSARQLIWCHLEMIKRTRNILPINHFVIENVSFDFQKLENEDIDDWNHGPLYGFKDYKEYISCMQHGKCLLCENKIEHYHHIIPRGEGGSNTIGNIAGLCLNHHDHIHKDKEFQTLLSELKEGYKQRYKVSLLNTIMPFLLKECEEYCKERNIQFTVTNGYQTKLTSKKYNLEKDHDIDAYAISLFNRKVSNVKLNDNAYNLKRFKKKTNANINKLGQREYYLNNKLVAVNRRKSTGQKDNSLKEFIEIFDDKEDVLKNLTVKPARRVYSYKRSGTAYPFHVGDIVSFYKKNKTDKKEYNDRFVVLQVDMNNRSLYYTNTKNRRMKYCKRVKPGAIQYI